MDGAALDERRDYELPERLPFNHWALAGEWTIGAENVALVGCQEMDRSNFVLTLSDGSIKGKGIKLAFNGPQTID